MNLYKAIFRGSTKFVLDYEKMIFLDAENLAEAGIKRAYARKIVPRLGEYVSEIAEVQEIIDNSAPSYSVTCGGLEYAIYAPGLPDQEGQSWGRATHALFELVNAQLVKSEYRLYAVNGGNDLGGIFLTQSECDSARRALPRKDDWPYLPTLEHPWYGQFHG
jgi:hypothetical protein